MMLTLGRYTLFCTNDFKTFQQFKYLIGELMNALMFFLWSFNHIEFFNFRFFHAD